MLYVMRTITQQILLDICKNVRPSIAYQREIKRFFSAVHEPDNLSDNQLKTFVSFDQILENRRLEACRSIIVQVKNEKSYDDLLSCCLQFGNVRNTLYYSIKNKSNYILIEYEKTSGSEEALRAGRHNDASETMPIKSPMLWFRTGMKGIKRRTDLPPLKTESNELPSVSELETLLKESDSFSNDMVILYNRLKLNELGTRLRFITAMQVETAFKGLFPCGRVVPFGSSINGFGKIGCDLDLVYEFDESTKFIPLNSHHERSRLIFHSKETNRLHNQRHLETIADILQYFLPGCCQVRRILRARIPIVRYKQDITGIDCDLSSTNMSGVFMSELLYMYGSYDSRVCPLVFTVRFWAKEINLTNPAPGRWITNFSITLLVLFYLQHVKLLPTLETLIKYKRPEDTRVTDDIDCSFLRDLNLLPIDTTVKNDDSLLSLLFGFFQFYSSFDFGSYAVSLNTGIIIAKPEYAALYIVNPLEKYLNVSKNISPEECERLKMQFRSAACLIECATSNLIEGNGKWGLLNLINDLLLNRFASIHKPGSMKSSSKIEFKELFNEHEINENSSMNKLKNKKNVKNS